MFREVPVLIEAIQDAMQVRIGATFDALDVMRLREAVAALGPFSAVAIDFAAVRECDDAALLLLAAELSELSRGEVAVRGLTDHQWRLLTFLGAHPNVQTRRAPRAPR